ncbi:MAG: DUF3810 domain-containing protein [Bacteroidales bacterium]|mgnify:FL=1|nr:DUF3810 domain-containing protein [Bacteroidales bacterium]
MVIVIRYVPNAGEIYALYFYPKISLALSWVSSFIPISLEEWIVIVFVLMLLFFPFFVWRRRKQWKGVLLVELEIIGWSYVWFYLGWGATYFRNDMLTRLNLKPVSIDKTEFVTFLNEYTDKLNSCYLRIDSIERDATLREIQTIYNTFPKEYGLAKAKAFQRPKNVVFNNLYSGVGVLGYMGPFMCESQVNLDLLPSQYAFTLAHETSHLLGVSSEAEANYWAYKVCVSSNNPTIRFSGYFCMLPYVWQNARGILSKDEMDEWKESIKVEILNELQSETAYWQAKRNPFIDSVQEKIYNWFLKSNNIKSGMANYSEVIGLIMAVRKDEKK